MDAVQAQLAANHHENRARTNAKSKSLLAGLFHDNAGNRLVSSHAIKNGKRYRYYVTSEGTGRSVAAASAPRLRLPAAVIDELVRAKLQSFLTDKTQTDTTVQPSQDKVQDNIISLEAAVPTAPGGGSGKLVFEDQNGKTPDAIVVKAIARASVWFEHLTAGKSQSMAEIAVRENVTDNYVSNLIHLAWLSPELIGQVLDGDSEATALVRAAMLTRKSDLLWKPRSAENGRSERRA